MRNLPTTLITRNIELQREPRIAIKIFNDQGAFWFLSHDDIAPGDMLDTFGGLVATSSSSQKIDPEKGWSTIGGMSIRMQDRGGLLTDRLRAIDGAGDSLNQNKAEVFFGFRGMAFADYGKLYTFIVDGIESDEIEYSFKLSDRQRLQKRQIFTPRSTKLFAVVEGGNLNDLTTETSLDGSGVIELLDGSQVSLVEHDADWDTDPSQTIGYFSIKGVDSAGNNIEEVFSFTGFDGINPSRLTGVTRSRFGTGAIEAKGSVNDGSTEVSEYVYLDLSVPKMIIALLTGDLYGQPGATIPDHWCALLEATDIDLASFENIGDDLWALPFGFQGAEKDEAKGFIGRELLRACDLFLKVNQDGELELKRFASVPQNAAPAHVFDESEVLSISNLNRDATHIRNRFQINWEYRSDIERFVRSNRFIDLVSRDKYNIVSDILDLNFKGLRNRSRDIQNTIQSLAEGIRARYSAPAVRPTVEVPMAYGLEIEVGDVIAIILSQWPDYANVAGLSSSFEVQSTSIDLISQTMTLGLFGTSGEPTPINFGEGDDVVDIDHTGWKELSAALTAAGISYTVAGGTLTITGNGTLAGGDTTAPANRYYYDGNVTVQSGVTLNVTKNFVLDAADIDLSGATFDGRGGGLEGGTGVILNEFNQIISEYTLGQQGYFGGEDLAESGLWLRTDGNDRIINLGRTNGSVPASRSQIESLSLRVNDNSEIIGFDGMSFLGSSGSGGARSVSNPDKQGLTGSASGDGGRGGASITFICENLFTNSSTVIDTSGGNANPAYFPNTPSLIRPRYAGAGGPGWPGCLLVFVKSKSSAVPILTGRHVAEVGIVDGLIEYDYYTKRSGDPTYVPGSGNDYTSGPLASATALAYKGVDIASAVRLIKFITSDTQATPTQGVDKIGPADLPTISLAEQINTPQTPKGNVSTITVTATPPADARYSYSIFEYRALGQAAWYPLEYKIPNETTKELPTDGSTYEFSARSVSVSGQISTGRRIATRTLSVVSEEPGETNTDDPAIQVPDVTGLALSNPGDLATQWIGPNAEFEWGKISLSGQPFQDLHLAYYLVEIRDSSTGTLRRTSRVNDTFYVYTIEKNIEDGSGTPVRGIHIDVTAIARTGKTSTAVRLTVTNPAPVVVNGVVVIYSREGIELSYTPPGDTDFRGVRVRGKLFTGSSVMLAPMTTRSETLSIVSVDEFGDGASTGYAISNPAPAAPALAVEGVGFTSARVNIGYPSDYDLIGADVRFRTAAGPGPWSTAVRITANEVALDGLVQGTAYNVEVTPVDTLGSGTAATASFTTDVIDAADVSGLSDWATETDPVDLAFIQANMANDSVPSDKIGGLTVAKLTAGQVVVQIDLGTGILLDGANGIIETINSGYSVLMGPVSRPALSANPVVLHDWNAGLSASTFWFDLAGNLSLGKGGLTYDIGSDTTTLTGNVVITGGSGIGQLSDAGALATANSANWTTQVSGTGKPSNNADVTKNAIQAVTTITAGGISAGKPNYGSVANGWFLGFDGANPGFAIGNVDKYFKVKPSADEFILHGFEMEEGNFKDINISGLSRATGTTTLQLIMTNSPDPANPLEFEDINAAITYAQSLILSQSAEVVISVAPFFTQILPVDIRGDCSKIKMSGNFDIQLSGVDNSIPTIQITSGAVSPEFDCTIEANRPNANLMEVLGSTLRVEYLNLGYTGSTQGSGNTLFMSDGEIKGVKIGTNLSQLRIGSFFINDTVHIADSTIRIERLNAGWDGALNLNFFRVSGQIGALEGNDGGCKLQLQGSSLSLGYYSFGQWIFQGYGSSLYLSGSINIGHLEDFSGYLGDLHQDTKVYRRGNYDEFRLMPEVLGNPIITRGSNANGEYIKFADGTLICLAFHDPGTFNVNTVTGNVFRAATFTGAFPVAFISQPKLANCAPLSGNGIFLSVSTGQDGAANYKYSIFHSQALTGRTENFGIIAIGRWY